MRAEIFGYQISIAPEGMMYCGSPVAYLLKGKKVTYRLVRNSFRPNIMYVVNSMHNICGLKGNYTFDDKDGDLNVYSEFSYKSFNPAADIIQPMPE